MDKRERVEVTLVGRAKKPAEDIAQVGSGAMPSR
jgi:hypothetical protein